MEENATNLDEPSSLVLSKAQSQKEESLDPAPDTERTAAKAEKFKYLATKRTNKICHEIQLLGNLSSRNNYTYTEEQVEKIFAAITQQVNLAQEKFNTSQANKASFVTL